MMASYKNNIYTCINKDEYIHIYTYRSFYYLFIYYYALKSGVRSFGVSTFWQMSNLQIGH
jgi:hypothetical protein